MEFPVNSHSQNSIRLFSVFSFFYGKFYYSTIDPITNSVITKRSLEILFFRFHKFYFFGSTSQNSLCTIDLPLIYTNYPNFANFPKTLIRIILKIREKSISNVTGFIPVLTIAISEMKTQE